MREIHERVRVYARSQKGQVQPLQFVWKEQIHSVREVLSVRKQNGKSQLYFYFEVGIYPEGTCELEFELRTGHWYLIRGDFSAAHKDGAGRSPGPKRPRDRILQNTSPPLPETKR